MPAQGNALGCGGTKIAKPQRGGPSGFGNVFRSAAPLGLVSESPQRTPGDAWGYLRNAPLGRRTDHSR